MIAIQEIRVKSILSQSGIPGADYCINPYVGCYHGCNYCYATFMRKYTGHTEQWGSFVDVRMNASEVLQKQLKRAAKGNVIISSVTDAYQPIEAHYKITRQCLEALLTYQFPVDILTKSPLVLRDLDLIKEFNDIEVGITITTDDDAIRKIFEPRAPSIEARINTLRTLYKNGIRTYAFIGPLLPMNPEALSEKIHPYADSVLIDKMNYISKTQKIFSDIKLTKWLDKSFTNNIIQKLKKVLMGKAVCVC